MAPPVVSKAQIVKQLTTSWEGYENGIARSWSGNGVTFSLGDGGQWWDLGHDSQALTSTEKSVARLAFQQWNELTNLHIQEVSSGGDIRFNYSTSESPKVAADTVNDPALPEIIGGNNQSLGSSDIWISASQSTNADANLTIGSYGLLTFEHEIGHALGLSHPGVYNATDGADPTYAANAEYSRDTRQYTIMSYFAPGSDGSGADFGGYNPQTPMIDDIMAIQAKYGANMTTRATDTVYGFNSNIAGTDSQIYNFNLNSHPVFTIWDAGGADTINASGFTAKQNINLNAGTYSDIGGLKQNVGIAYNVTIENAIGGQGDDTLTGNAVANNLVGGGGADTLNGGAGFDYLAGGAGNDSYVLQDVNFIAGLMRYDTVDEFAGGGVDTVRVQAASGRNPLTGASVAVTSYTLTDNVENGIVTGSAAFDLTGNASNNQLTGNSAANTLSGGAGNDILNGMGGLDTLVGGAGNDTYNLADANYGAIFTPFGVTGFAAHYDLVQEDAGGGIDTVNVGRATAAGNALLPTVTLTSYTLGDNIENGNVTGTGDFDLAGNALNNQLTGNAGVNTLSGGDGDDTLNGKGGLDTLIGGAGNDVYVLGDASLQTSGVGGPAGIVFAGFDKVVEAADGGTDTVMVGRASVNFGLQTLTATNYNLGDNIENGIVTGTGAFNLTGNALDNRLTGNSAVNTLDGGAGDDILTGGLGADVFRYVNAGFGNDMITDFAAGSAAGHDVLSINHLFAGDFATVMGEFTQVGSNAVLNLGTNLSVTLENTMISGLTAADFQFV